MFVTFVVYPLESLKGQLATMFIQLFNNLASLRSWPGFYVANLVANSESRTSFEEVQVKQRMKHQIMPHSVYYQILNISTKNCFFRTHSNHRNDAL